MGHIMQYMTYNYSIRPEKDYFVITKERGDGNLYEYTANSQQDAEKWIEQDKEYHKKYRSAGMKAARYLLFETRINHKIEMLGDNVEWYEEHSDGYDDFDRRRLDRLCRIRAKVEHLYYSRKLHMKPTTFRFGSIVVGN